MLEPPSCARALGVEVNVVSPDTVFSQGVSGLHDGILALYHDQAFIPLKLMGAAGVTFVAGCRTCVSARCTGPPSTSSGNETMGAILSRTRF